MHKWVIENTTPYTNKKTGALGAHVSYYHAGQSVRIYGCKEEAKQFSTRALANAFITKNKLNKNHRPKSL